MTLDGGDVKRIRSCHDTGKPLLAAQIDKSLSGGVVSMAI
jgi:hypothetical protein